MTSKRDPGRNLGKEPFDDRQVQRARLGGEHGIGFHAGSLPARLKCRGKQAPRSRADIQEQAGRTAMPFGLLHDIAALRFLEPPVSGIAFQLPIAALRCGTPVKVAIVIGAKNVSAVGKAAVRARNDSHAELHEMQPRACPGRGTQWAVAFDGGAGNEGAVRGEDSVPGLPAGAREGSIVATYGFAEARNEGRIKIIATDGAGRR